MRETYQQEPHERYNADTVRELEKEMFPEFRDDDLLQPEGNIYFYWAPSRHFKSELMTDEVVQSLVSDDSKKLLSLGSGPAHLERLLTKLGVKKENTTLVDIDPRDVPPDFTSKIFDMYSEWTDLGDELYDLIIFPESTLFHTNFKTDQEIIDGAYKLITQALSHLKPGGSIRMSCLLNDIEIETLTKRFAYEGKKVDITKTKSRNTLVIKNELSPNSD